MERAGGYRRILVAIDCSDHSNRATGEALRLARLHGGEITGVHAYAAALHDHRFRQMEGGLPERYRREPELERQRDVHDQLITRGLSLITDSYLDQTERACREAGVRFSRRGAEGRNYRVILDEARTGGHDLLVLGAQGLGAVQPGALGSVCERVARRTPIDTLVVKRLDRELGDGPIAVALDGSHHSFGGLVTALELGRALEVDVHAVAVYDPYFHYVAFNRIAEVLSEEAGRVFRFQEQEQLHEEIIDSGLAKIYEAHLAIARSIAEERDAALETTLLDGKPYDALLRYVEQLGPSLLVLGKLGIHADDELDIGGNTHQLLRLAPCNVLIGVRRHVPDVETVARETTSWSEEAEARLERVPEFVRNMARMAILRFAQERGHTVITAGIVDEATAALMPRHAHRAMQEIVAGADGAPDAGAPLPWSRDARSLADGVADPALRRSVALRAEKRARRDGSPEVDAGHVRPFLPSAPPAPPTWTGAALRRLERVPEGFMRDASRERVLRLAEAQRRAEITLEVVEEALAGARSAMAEAMPGGIADDGGDGFQPTLPWDPDALRVLERVPIGFMRRLTGERIEARAERLGRARITLQAVEEQLAHWQRHSEAVVRQLEWDAEAWAEISSAPVVVRGMIVRELEAGALRDGVERVSVDYVRRARRVWQKTGRFHVAPTEEY